MSIWRTTSSFRRRRSSESSWDFRQRVGAQSMEKTASITLLLFESLFPDSCLWLDARHRRIPYGKHICSSSGDRDHSPECSQGAYIGQVAVKQRIFRGVLPWFRAGAQLIRGKGENCCVYRFRTTKFRSYNKVIDKTFGPNKIVINYYL